MPDGTIQDSRRPTSPQWGYLKLDQNANTFTLNRYAIDDPKLGVYAARFGTGTAVDKWPPIFDTGWNQYIMFLHNIQENGDTKRLVRETQVRFEMVKATINIKKEDLPEGVELPDHFIDKKIWVAIVTDENTPLKPQDN